MDSRRKGAFWRFIIASYLSTLILGLPVLVATLGWPSFAPPLDPEFRESFFFGSQGAKPAQIFYILPGLIGPVLGALVGWHHLAGKKGLKSLFAHLSRFGGFARWLWLMPFLIILAISLPPAIFVAAQGGENFLNLGITTSLAILVVMTIFVTSEEIAWRGFLQPFMQEKYGFWKSVLLVTLIWGWWHFPIAFVMGYSEAGLLAGIARALFYPVLTLVGTIWTALLFNRSGGAIILPVLVHGMFNWSGLAVRFRHPDQSIEDSLIPIAQGIFVASLIVTTVIAYFWLRRGMKLVTTSSMLARTSEG